MHNSGNRRSNKSWTSETVRRFVEMASNEDVLALHQSFKRQAGFLRRQGRDISAAFLEVLADGVADAANRSDWRTGAPLLDGRRANGASRRSERSNARQARRLGLREF
jgi:hypothetical protein